MDSGIEDAAICVVSGWGFGLDLWDGWGFFDVAVAVRETHLFFGTRKYTHFSRFDDSAVLFKRD